MAIDKSLSQYQQNLLRGTTLDALRKAGITDAPIQNYATPRITVQAPKVQNISLPESQASMPATKIKAASPITRLLGESPGGAGLGSFDSKRYNALARSFFDQATKQAMDDPNLKYVSKFLNRPYGPRTVADVADKSDPSVDAEENQPYAQNFVQNLSGTTPLAPLTLSLPSEEEDAPSYSNEEIEEILKSADSDTENFITKAFDAIKDNPYVKAGAGVGKNFLIDTTVKNTLAKQLGIGSMFGPMGMLFSWIYDTVKSKITGEKKTGSVYGLFNKLTEGSKKDVDPADEGFTVSGTYGDNEVYSSDGSSVDSETGDITNADGTYGGNIVDEFVSTPAPTPIYTPPSPVIDSGNGDSGGGWSGSGGRSDDSWSSSPFNKGGRVDKALTGRRRDI